MGKDKKSITEKIRKREEARKKEQKVKKKENNAKNNRSSKKYVSREEYDVLVKELNKQSTIISQLINDIILFNKKVTPLSLRFEAVKSAMITHNVLTLDQLNKEMDRVNLWNQKARQLSEKMEAANYVSNVVEKVIEEMEQWNADENNLHMNYMALSLHEIIPSLPDMSWDRKFELAKQLDFHPGQITAMEQFKQTLEQNSVELGKE